MFKNLQKKTCRVTKHLISGFVFIKKASKCYRNISQYLIFQKSVCIATYVYHDITITR